MPNLRKLIRFLFYFLVTILVVITALFLYIVYVGQVNPPDIHDATAENLKPKSIDSTCRVIGNNWIRKNSYGIWEMYVEGKPYERGLIIGKLSQGLIREQEEAFTEQINKLVPSSFYRHFLKYFIGWFNRDLEENIIEEYKQEIYGVSQSASHDFDFVGPPYQRLMNYHAAHDIGHALQNLALVGCTSFGTWNSRSADSSLIIGRNFDFYVGDRFAENKIVLFIKPDKGYSHMMVTWGGMIGVVSGMNTAGLTITLNAAKSEIPSGSATPISILAREILQYAGNINEAVEIAHKRKVFVSEALLIGSVKDNKAVSIEVTPGTVAVHESHDNFIICTNHYQSDELVHSERNEEQMKSSASVYRYKRMQELLSSDPKNTVINTASILRNTLGAGGSDIGLGNEKAVNQLICHHAVIFKPASAEAWVSSAPWNMGAFVAYNLDSVFRMANLETDREISIDSLNIAPDTLVGTPGFKNFIKFRALRQSMIDGNKINPDELIRLNPEYYHSYVLAGDYAFRQGIYAKAQEYYSASLNYEIATLQEKNYILDRIDKCAELQKNK